MAKTTPTGNEIDLAYAILGTSDNLGAAPEDFGQLIALGKNWVRSNIPHLRKSICENALTRAFIDNGNVAAAVTLLVQAIPGITPAKAGAIVLLATRGFLQIWCESPTPMKGT